MKVSIDNKFYQVESDGIYLEEMNFRFNQSEINIYKSLITSDCKILDVGGNIGLTSLFFIENSKHVEVFEPIPSTFRLLQNNLKQCAQSKYRLNNFGLGSKNNELLIAYPPTNRASAFIAETVEAHSEYIKENIQIYKLDYLIKKKMINNFHFIKLDVEGFELEVLLGASKAIRRNKPIVAMEMNHFCLNAFRDISIPKFISSLRRMFPVLMAVDNERYLDLHSRNDSYHVTWDHIVNGKFNTVVGAFDESQVLRFKAQFEYGIGG